MRRSCATARLVKARIRQAQAMYLRASGLDYESIARRLGYSSRSSAHRAVRKGMDATRDRAAIAYRIFLTAKFESCLEQVAIHAATATDCQGLLSWLDDKIVRAEYEEWYERRWA